MGVGSDDAEVEPAALVDGAGRKTVDGLVAHEGGPRRLVPVGAEHKVLHAVVRRVQVPEPDREGFFSKIFTNFHV